jgi:hypothetical protein
MPNELPPDGHPTDSDVIAARAATMMAYVVALAGALAATLSLRDGRLVDALLVLTTTLGVAALLAATGTLLRALRRIERRLRALERGGPSGDPGSAPR